MQQAQQFGQFFTLLDPGDRPGVQVALAQFVAGPRTLIEHVIEGESQALVQLGHFARAEHAVHQEEDLRRPDVIFGKRHARRDQPFRPDLRPEAAIDAVAGRGRGRRWRRLGRRQGGSQKQ